MESENTEQNQEVAEEETYEVLTEETARELIQILTMVNQDPNLDVKLTPEQRIILWQLLAMQELENKLGAIDIRLQGVTENNHGSVFANLRSIIAGET